MRFLSYVVAGAALLVTGWLLIHYGWANPSRVFSGQMAVHVDFATFHDSAAALWHGGDLYGTGAQLANLDPPFWTVLISPFGLLPPLLAYRIFAVLTALMILGAAALVAWRLRVRWWLTALALLAFALASPLLGTVALGQIYGVLALCLAGYWVAAALDHQRAAGILLGIVLALKPTLAPLILLPVMQQRWPMLRWTIASGAVATLASALVAGPGQFLRWVGVVLHQPMSTFSDNASLPSTIARLGGPAWLGYVLGVLAVVITLRQARRPGPLALWSLVAASLLLSPVAWHNYLVLVFPGAIVVLHQRRHAAAALLCLPLIDVNWSKLVVGDGLIAHLGQSLYCGILLTYWLVLLPRERSQDQPAELDQEVTGWSEEVGSVQPML
jgi:alpha-1,2-mannosyltransferase/arabinofuranan 3-O-arabinosyltransferase